MLFVIYRMNNMKLMDIFKREQKKRDEQVLKWLDEDVSKAQIARNLGITRQRAQTLIDRILANKNGL